MASRVSEWRLEDCIVFVKKIAKSFGGSIPESDLEFILESFRKNHMIGASLLAFGDKEWEQLIPSLGFRFHCREAIMKKIKQEETEILSKLQQKGAPRKTIKETAQLTGLTKISAFFSLKHKKSDDVLNLPDDVEFFSVSAESTEPAVTATILSSDNVQKFIEHLLSKEKPETGFASLLLRKAVLEYLSLDGNQVKSS